MAETWRLGVDSGGTFTDVCLANAAGDRIVWKTPSSPEDPSEAIMAAILGALDAGGAAAKDISFLGHGTTVATNALIEGVGAPTGLITTKGFGDLLEIGRQQRPHLYDLQAEKPKVLVARRDRLEVSERVRHDGAVETPLDEAEVRRAALRLKDAGVRAVAVCYLYSFVRGAHEERTREILTEAFPEAFVSLSSEVAPEFREFERLSTTVVNATLGPIMHAYLGRLSGRLREAGVEVRPHVTQSNGGVVSFEAAGRFPVRTILSGPSTGVAAAADVGAKAGARRLVTFDMGGTSTDVALLEDGACALASEAVVHGYPIKARMLDINTVGAGGGSIAFVDGGGLMKVGPRSAGAVPGPACYGKGGAEATVTDANLVLGMLNPSHLLGGRMAVRADLAAAAIGALGAALGLDPLRAADGILTVVTANMARAVRVISVQRGRDLRDFALIAFGGAGPLHAARLARELGIKTILVPRSPGALCAEGLVTSAVRTSFSKTKSMTLSPEAAPLVAAAFTELLARAEPWFLSEGVGAAEQDLARSIDIRYRGQNFELEVPYPEAETTPASLERLANRFEELHEQRYGFAARGDPIQLVTFRLEAKGRAPPPLAKAEALRGEDPSDALVGRRAVWFSEACGFTATPVYERDRLGAGARLAGPAVVEQFDSTTLIPPGMTARVDPYLTLVLEDR